jgi:glycosyltransferase involved in cell wall biosynthesis
MGLSVRRLAALIGRELSRIPVSPSLVHASRIGREFLAQAALDLARRRQVPFVLTPNHHPRWHGLLYRQYDKIYRAADAVLALTEVEKDVLIRTKGVHEDRVHVTGIGPVLSEKYSAERFCERFGIRPPMVLYLGQQLKYKGVGAVLEAAPLVWRRHPQARFVFIGPQSDYSRRLFAGVRDERLVNLGSVDLETKTSALAACQLLCVPSLQESFGGVFVEAWSHRKAVIGGRIPPVAAVIDEGRNGFLSSQAPEELAATVSRLLSEPEECQALGAAGWQKVQARYAWPALARKTLEVYESLGVPEALQPASAAGAGAEASSSVAAYPGEGR